MVSPCRDCNAARLVRSMLHNVFVVTFDPGEPIAFSATRGWLFRKCLGTCGDHTDRINADFPAADTNAYGADGKVDRPQVVAHRLIKSCAG